MATSSIGRTRCFTCNKEKATSKCAGCLKDFCYTHLGDHRQQLANQLDEIEVHRDLFRQALNEQITDPQIHSLIKGIDQWEQTSINKIHETVKEAKQILFQHNIHHTNQLEEKLKILTDQIRECREENDILETDLIRWQNELVQLNEQLIKPQNVTIEFDSAPLVNKFRVIDESSKVMSSVQTILSTSNSSNKNQMATTTVPYVHHVSSKNSEIYSRTGTSTKSSGKIIQLSKALSWLLRHAVIREGLQYQYDGYVFVEDVLEHPTFANKYTMQDIYQCVETNEKQRFALKIDPTTGKQMIRAQHRQ